MEETSSEFTVPAGFSRRLDVFLAGCLPRHSRSRLQGLIRSGRVTIDGLPASRPSQLLQAGQRIVVTVPPPAPVNLVPEMIPLDILFENSDLLVINTPAGMVVHPSPGHDSGTLVHAVLGHVPGLEGIGGEERPGIVHRLDKDTSGLILVAKNEAAHRWLQDQFRLRLVNKTYIALVDGHPPSRVGRIEAPIARDPSHRKEMAVTSPGKGREAVSEYRLIEDFPNHALLEVHPLTGRTHQIRLHLAFLGCPVVGDRVYGSRKPSLPLERHFLHAARLQVALPGEEAPRQFSAELPVELQQILNSLKERDGHEDR